MPVKPIRDLFSGHSDVYEKYRPDYPPSLYQAILQYTPGRGKYWDCATGNGQVARVLAGHFKQACATDISKNQLEKAPVMANLTYKVSRAEDTGFEANTFDLITVAQAIHWFDITAFLEEARRVGRAGCTLAVWGYGQVRFGGVLDDHIEHFYREVVGPYWAGERAHIDSAYADIDFNLNEEADLGNHRIEKAMNLQSLRGYLTSWSSVQNYIRKHGDNPVDPFIETLGRHWKGDAEKIAVFPLFGKMGRLGK